jgi:hypothetical protein
LSRRRVGGRDREASWVATLSMFDRYDIIDEADLAAALGETFRART